IFVEKRYFVYFVLVTKSVLVAPKKKIMKKKPASSEEDNGEESGEDSNDDAKKTKKKKKKKKKGGAGRKKRPDPVPVYLPPTKEMLNLFKERPKKPIKKKDVDQETPAEKLWKDWIIVLPHLRLIQQSQR